MVQLTGSIFPGPALTVVGILSGNRIARLGAFHDLAPLILCESQHDRQNEVAGEGVLNEAYVQNVNPDILPIGS